jgi:hypothetical protein
MDKDCVDLFRLGQGHLEACFHAVLKFGVPIHAENFLII